MKNFYSIFACLLMILFNTFSLIFNQNCNKMENDEKLNKEKLKNQLLALEFNKDMVELAIQVNEDEDSAINW